MNQNVANLYKSRRNAPAYTLHKVRFNLADRSSIDNYLSCLHVDSFSLRVQSDCAKRYVDRDVTRARGLIR